MYDTFLSIALDTVYVVNVLLILYVLISIPLTVGKQR